MYYPELAKGMKHFKEEGGRRRMCEAVGKYANRQMLNKQIEMIKNRRIFPLSPVTVLRLRLPAWPPLAL